MKDLLFTWVTVIGGAFLQDINIALAACSYLGASIYTGIKIYKHFKNERGRN
jgi:hypothetical protein